MKSPRFKRPFRISYGTRSLTFAPLGKWTIALTLALGAAAVNSGSNLLYLVVAMMLSMVIISGVLSENSLKGLLASRRLPAEVYAGTPFTITYTLKNTKRRIPSFAFSAADYGPDGEPGPSAFVLKLSPGDGVETWAEAVIPRRGQWDVSGIMLSTVFPFGLFRKTLKLPGARAAVVFPQVFPVDEGALELPAHPEGERESERRGEGAGIRNIREYQPTDEARRIHWKSAARQGRLMVKEFESEARTAVCVALDNLLPRGGAWDESAFEDAVSLAASITRHLIVEKDRPVSFACRGMSIPEGSGRGHCLEILEALAFIGPASGGEFSPDPSAALVLIGPDGTVSCRGGAPIAFREARA